MLVRKWGQSWWIRWFANSWCKFQEMKSHTLNIPAWLRKGAAYSSVGERMVKTTAHVEAGLWKNCTRSSFPGPNNHFRQKRANAALPVPQTVLAGRCRDRAFLSAPIVVTTLVFNSVWLKKKKKKFWRDTEKLAHVIKLMQKNTCCKIWLESWQEIWNWDDFPCPSSLYLNPLFPPEGWVLCMACPNMKALNYSVQVYLCTCVSTL